VIKTRNNSPENLYVQKAYLNGQELTRCWIYAREVQKGGKLLLEMGAEPNKNWGTGEENQPPDPNK
jgi:putative alpha-1,2-mannosidase